MTATKGTWATSADTTYAYAWQRAATPPATTARRSRAVAATYKPVTADVDSTLKVIVTATNPDAAVTATSAATAKVKLGAAGGQPDRVPSGTATVGQDGHRHHRHLDRHVGDGHHDVLALHHQRAPRCRAARPARTPW